MPTSEECEHGVDRVYVITPDELANASTVGRNCPDCDIPTVEDDGWIVCTCCHTYWQVRGDELTMRKRFRVQADG